jgi:hypothetical protein
MSNYLSNLIKFQSKKVGFGGTVAFCLVLAIGLTGDVNVSAEDAEDVALNKIEHRTVTAIVDDIENEIRQSGLAFRSDTTPEKESRKEGTKLNTLCREISDQGISALVPLVKEMEDSCLEKKLSMNLLHVPFEMISRVKFSLQRDQLKIRGTNVYYFEEYPGIIVMPSGPNCRLLVRWWREYRNRIEKRLKHLLSLSQVAHETGEHAKSKDHLLAMEKFGVFAVPFLVDNIQNSKINLVPVLARIMENKGVKSDSSKNDVSRWWRENKDRWKVVTEQEGTPR